MCRVQCYLRFGVSTGGLAMYALRIRGEPLYSGDGEINE